MMISHCRLGGCLNLQELVALVVTWNLCSGETGGSVTIQNGSLEI
jgi:hypothetical protein